MHFRRIAALIFVAVLALSCAPKKQQQVQIPLPPVPSPAMPSGTSSTDLQAVSLPAPPEITMALPPMLPSPIATSAPPRPPRRTTASHPASQSSGAAPPAAQVPLQLGVMLTPDQRRQLNQAIDASVARARQNLASATSHGLDSRRREMVAQVENFLKQAQTTRGSDLEAAHSLADRAALLSQQLADSLR